MWFRDSSLKETVCENVNECEVNVNCRSCILTHFRDMYKDDSLLSLLKIHKTLMQKQM